MTQTRPAMLAAALLAMLAASPALADEERSATSRDVSGVVELFTSQGCSSCPPAGELLTRFSAERDLVALAYHVDYWDYIGWQDTHGSRENTERQRAYAKALGKGGIYTPQMVVNGQRGTVGSREADIRKALQETSLRASPALVTLSVDGKRLHVGVENGSGGPGVTTVLMLVTYTPTATTLVERGENKGMTMIDSNAVRDWRILGMGSDKPMETEIPLAALKPDPDTKIGCAAILQSVTEGGQPGPILAAVTIEF